MMAVELGAQYKEPNCTNLSTFVMSEILHNKKEEGEGEDRHAGVWLKQLGEGWQYLLR